MDRKVFLFPGQGSQYLGMGLDIYNEYPKIKNIYSLANKILDFNISEITFYDKKNKLNTTLYTQPAIFINSIIIFELLKKNNFIPHCVAGHSLGEITALYVANMLSFEEALHLVKIRAQLMEKCNIDYPGSMAVVLNASDKQIDEVCNQNGIIVKANYNSDQQMIISGEDKCINRAITYAKVIGVKMKKLNVSGAFHSPLMNKASIHLAKTINSLNFKKPTIPLYQNLTGKSSMDLDEIKYNLIGQIENPVLWKNIIINMSLDNYNNFYEIGPKNVLTNLTKNILDSPKAISIQSVKDINNLCLINS